MAKINRVERVSLYGGIIGSALNNPRMKIENKCIEMNAQGWNCHQIIYHGNTNLLIMIAQFIVLLLTLLMWTFAPGYLLIFEKEANSSGLAAPPYPQHGYQPNYAPQGIQGPQASQAPQTPQIPQGYPQQSGAQPGYAQPQI